MWKYTNRCVLNRTVFVATYHVAPNPNKFAKLISSGFLGRFVGFDHCSLLVWISHYLVFLNFSQTCFEDPTNLNTINSTLKAFLKTIAHRTNRFLTNTLWFIRSSECGNETCRCDLREPCRNSKEVQSDQMRTLESSQGLKRLKVPSIKGVLFTGAQARKKLE